MGEKHSFAAQPHHKVEAVLAARGKTHGLFATNAMLSQGLKDILYLHRGNLSDVQREAIDMILTKIARICAGDPNHKDSWLDVAGYATLAARELK